MSMEQKSLFALSGAYMLDPNNFTGMMLHDRAERIFQDLS